MAAEWPSLSLREANVVLIDCDHRTPPATEAGYPYVAIPQLRNGRIDLRDARRIAREHFLEWTRKAKPAVNDVVLSRRCNPGETGFVETDPEFALGQNLVLLRADGTKIYPPFLRWLVQGPSWWGQVGRFLNVGAVFDSLKCAEIPKFELPIPPLEEQRAITHILGTLDDKIELNRHISATAEAMAQAIFKSWFVDFDPVRANAEGRDPGLPKSVAALFPTHLVESELGEVPEGWIEGSFGDLISQRTERVGARDVVVLSAVADGKLKRSDDHFTKRVYSKDTAKYLLVEQWDFAYNPSRINIGSIGMLEEAILGGVSPVYVVARPKAAYRWFLEFSIRRASTKAWINTLASGSVRQSLSYTDFASIPCVLPSEAVVQEFNRRWTILREGIRLCEKESDTLAALRDTLLPKLISGELRIPSVRSAGQSVPV